MGTQIPSNQGFGDSNFHIYTFYWKVFEKGMKMHMISHVIVCFLTSYYILLAEFGELLIELHALKLTKGFQL
jgi:hypothetical protein